MYGDTTVMRKRAGQLREQGTDVRMLADQLMAQIDSLDWTGRAADTMRARVHDRAALLRDAASSHDTASESLGRHLADVDLREEAIEAAEHRLSSLVTDAATRVTRLEAHQDPDGIRRSPSEDDQALVSFVAPQPGHRDWLTVTLPGH